MTTKQASAADKLRSAIEARDAAYRVYLESLTAYDEAVAEANAEGLSMRGIAEIAGVSHQAIWFSLNPDKRPKAKRQ